MAFSMKGLKNSKAFILRTGCDLFAATFPPSFSIS